MRQKLRKRALSLDVKAGMMGAFWKRYWFLDKRLIF
jgi:hypothetical protein